MDPITITLSGGMLSMLGIVGRIVYNYGRDRKELNGTVERVKQIQSRLEQHIQEEGKDVGKVREDIARLETKVDLLIDSKIRME